MPIDIRTQLGNKPAPRDGSIFNAQYGDGVTKVRWNSARGDWEGALSDGRWLLLEYLRGRSPPLTWWPAAASFDVDDATASLLVNLQTAFGVDSPSEVIRKALALANIASHQAGADHTVTIAGEGKDPVKVSLAE